MKKLVLLAAGLSLLGGCAVPTQQIETVCLVKHEKLQTPEMLQALEAGVKSAGYQMTIVDAAAIPPECRLCLYYGVRVEKQKVKAVEFVAVKDGHALPKGSGSADAQGKLTYAAIASYAAAYLKQADADADERSETKEAPAEQ